MSPRNALRNIELARDMLEGMTYIEAADKYSITSGAIGVACTNALSEAALIKSGKPVMREASCESIREARRHKDYWLDRLDILQKKLCDQGVIEAGNLFDQAKSKAAKADAIYDEVESLMQAHAKQACPFSEGDMIKGYGARFHVDKITPHFHSPLGFAMHCSIILGIPTYSESVELTYDNDSNPILFTIDGFKRAD